METMKTSIEKLINSGVITSNTMFRYLLREQNLDYDFIETVYRLKPDWMVYCNNSWFDYSNELHNKLARLYIEDTSATPLFIALLKEDKTLENLLLNLGADVNDVVWVLREGFFVYGLERTRSLLSEMKSPAHAVK